MSMCSSGWNENVIATLSAKSYRFRFFAISPTYNSQLVRVFSPRRGASAESRPDAAEERVCDLRARLLAGLAEEHADRREVEGAADAHLLGDVPHVHVGGGQRGVGDDAEHPFRLVVERGQLRAPVGDVAPVRVVVEGV